MDAFDPWAGKSLGEVSKPKGFDEFWADHQAATNGGSSRFLEKQDALVRSEESRLEEAQIRRGRGRGRRGGPQRYSKPQIAPRARPTHFVAIRLYSKMIRRNVQQMQRWFIDKDPLWEKCIVPVKKLHSSLLLTAIPDERRADAQEACQQAGREIREYLGDQPVKLIASGVGHFNGQVLFTQIRTEPHEMLQAIHDALSRSFMEYGFPVLDENAKAWLEDGEDPHDFKAHASFLKASKAMAHAKSDQERRSFRQLKLISDDISAWRDVFFGSQLCHEFECLDMVGSARDGYYPCLQCERFNDRPIGPGIDPVIIPMAAGPLRTGRLRVEREGAGAGMSVSACGAGYLIEQLSEWPGQPDLHVGDVIVAISRSILFGLEEQDLERQFGEAFCDGVSIIVGNWEILQKSPQENVRRAAERLLRPWQNRSSQDDPSLTETASAGKDDRKSLGLRYKLRTTAETFTPDPLNQPGGDPWAKAAEYGYKHAAYTGWGTQFKTIYATRVDSSQFLPKPAVAVKYAEIERWDEERTALHRRIQAELRGARSHEHVLQTLEKERVLLSLANRALGFSRLAACGYLPDNYRKDHRYRNLQEDVQEDLEAVVEAQAALAPSVLANLALALGRLGLRRPELFHSLASIVRRVGIWTFDDNEVSTLLEGFSRAKLSDEVIFQEASRLVVARVSRIPPRPLTMMLTAFACSNIATEQLFFFAGDAIIAGQKHFTPGLLAELADAFSRVRARHEFLISFVPNYFNSACLADFKRCSVAALVKLLSAYVDCRQGLGFPDTFREIVAAAITQRQKEMTARLVRQVLQAMARAHWPHATLIEISAEIAKRDPVPWELEAMHECFFQMRVTAPPGFPARKPTEEKGSRKGAARTEAVVDNDMKAGEEASDAFAADVARQHLRIGKLHVAAGSAGLGFETCEAGYYVEEVADSPGQPDIRIGDAILAIGSRMLLGADEAEIDERFGSEFRDGASLVLGPLAVLQQIPLEDVRLAIQALLQTLSVSEASTASVSRAVAEKSGPEKTLQATSCYPSHTVETIRQAGKSHQAKGGGRAKDRGDPGGAHPSGKNEHKASSSAQGGGNGPPSKIVRDAEASNTGSNKGRGKGRGAPAKLEKRVWRAKES